MILIARINAPIRLTDFPPASDVPIEITEITPDMLSPQQKPKPSKKELEIAETEDANNRELDPNATILSDRNQKAEKQTKAKNIDDFRTGEGTGVTTRPKEGPAGIAPTGEPGLDEIPSEVATEESLGLQENKNVGIKRDWRTLSLQDLSVGGDGQPGSATDDRLNNIEQGDRTILSTREFRYFSYYQRIKELLRQHWKPAVERRLALLWAKGKNIRKHELTTELLILLDNRGTIMKISKVGTSGFNDIDSAAVEAFKKAAPFPNPPTGIVDPDGFVRIRWDFILKAQAAPVIQFRRPAAGAGDRIP